MSKDAASKRTRSSNVMRLWIAFLAFLLVVNLTMLATQTSKPTDGETWIVKRIINGQTIEAVPANSDSGVVQLARLIGVSAPIRDQIPWSDRALKRLETLAPKEKPVIFEFDSDRKDSSERLLVYLWVGDRLINTQLVKEGLILAEPMRPNLKYAEVLARAQSEARLLELEIWDPKQPMRLSPREFRR